MKEKELEAETVREEILRSVRELKEIRPLLHMIPSYVTAALCADAISAAGGRPLMAQAKEEMEEITDRRTDWPSIWDSRRRRSFCPAAWRWKRRRKREFR